MKRSIFGVLSILIFLSCQNQQKLNNFIAYIPADAAVILHTPNISKLETELNELSFLNKNSLTLAKQLKKSFGFLKYTDSIQEAVITFSFPTKKKLVTSIILPKSPGLNLDSLENKQVENIKKQGVKFQKTQLDEEIYYASLQDEPFIISNSEANLINLLKGKNKLNSEEFKEIHAAVDPDKTSLLLNHQRYSAIEKALLPNLKIPLKYSGWSAVDLQLYKEGISFNGLSIAQDSTSIVQLLKNTGPALQKMPEITPVSAKGFVAFAFSDAKQFLENLRQFRGDSLQKKNEEIILNTTEAGMIYLENTQVLAFRTPVDIDASDLITETTELTENYRDVPIFRLKSSEAFQYLLTPVFQSKNLEFVATPGEYLVFAKNKAILKYLIADYKNKNSLANSSYYQQATNNLAEASSLLVIGQPEKLKEDLTKVVASHLKNEMQSLVFEEQELAVLQLVEENDFSHLHGAISGYTAKTTGGKTEEMLSVTLEKDLLNEPVLIKNHLNNQMDIAVQDVDNTLYLISNKGTIFWKKKLKGPILGKIKQVDLFKNGKVQMAFATPYSIEVLDRNGNTVKPFPLEFKDEITQPLSLFDYDNNRKYRFLITQGNEVFMYDKNGKSVNGFKFKKAATKIVSAPKHIRMGNKDYIVFPEESGKLNILNRRGSHRVNVKKKIGFSNNNWFEFHNDFVSTNAEGQLVRVDANGNVRLENTSLAKNHHLTARPNLLVSFSENIVKIKDQSVNLDYGLYTEPKIFFLNNKYFISITDLQTQKVYLFDSNGELFTGLPVYGTSSIDLNDADIDPRLEFTVKGGDKEVLLYKLGAY
ncbi:hypothetical protein SAMN05444483_12715 [Salegentibacter echinorum]|uniref:Uncharacterized protein n=1 Tax=Salegentibacter echinorum TaxID=1073325 RepID=A0A1M5MDJ1_SALEC|nr:DUF3352 domain-containing protein [Salegentibacter echinorum]SHG75317.1 hypothetical protein SAMN05444483_12715 [Salegentibacter echinorum]